MDNTSAKKAVSKRDLYFFRQRQRNNVFQAVLAYFAERAKKDGLTQKKLAQQLGKDPSQITRWFSGPGNWTLDTISDLLLAMEAESRFSIASLKDDASSAQGSTGTSSVISSTLKTVSTSGTYPLLDFK